MELAAKSTSFGVAITTLGLARNRNSPQEVDFEQSTIFVEYWHGLFCYEKSEMEGSETFPLTDQGRADMIAWLESKI